MDPVACLAIILDASNEWDARFDAMASLYSWLNRGGFRPVVRGTHYVAIGNGDNESYSLLCNRHEAALIKYWHDGENSRSYTIRLPHTSD